MAMVELLAVLRFFCAENGRAPGTFVMRSLAVHPAFESSSLRHSWLSEISSKLGSQRTMRS
jgi:hypothetical protein